MLRFTDNSRFFYKIYRVDKNLVSNEILIRVRSADVTRVVYLTCHYDYLFNWSLHAKTTRKDPYKENI